jgi:hypothetical protein
MVESLDYKKLIPRTVVIVSIVLTIALVHAFRLGTCLDGIYFTLYYSYFSDFILPFGMYFLLCLNDQTIPILSDWRVKGLLVFTIATATEVLQAFGIYALGVTYDPFDIVAFLAGVLCAIALDKAIFSRWLYFWRIEM